jgi:hypothetical protein
MKFYVCLETINENPDIKEKIKQYHDDGHTITIACTREFRANNSREEIQEMLSPLKNYYHNLSFLKPDYDKIIDIKSATIQFAKS